MTRIFNSFVAFLILGSSVLFAQAELIDRLFRFPAIHGERIVFTYAGDLYTVSASGGVARKLTSHDGFEMFARFSPDGTQIAFTGQYDGNTEVYLIPSAGGVPKRLTHTATLGRDDVSDRMGPNNIVMDWKDNATVMFRSRRIEFNDWKGQLFLISTKGGLPQQIELPRGGFGTFSRLDNNLLVYNRVFREFRTWKRYTGGQADDIWLYHLASKDHRRLTGDAVAQDIIPMFGTDGKVYFISDRGKRMNLFSYDIPKNEVQQITHYTDYDIKFPSIGPDALIFEKGGSLFTYNYKETGAQPKKVEIVILNDFESGRGKMIDVSKSVTNYEISRDGNRALFGSRGDIFTVPAKEGPTRNLTETPGIHERNSLWSPDAKWIAYISDATGEDEIYILSQDGKNEVRQLTKNADTYKYAFIWSPDSRFILWADKKLRLQYIDIASQKVTLVDQAEAWEFSDYAWSPDSKWITYAKPQVGIMSTLHLYSVESGRKIQATDGWFTSYSPRFSADGKYLFFLSNRSFTPQYGMTEWNHIYRDMTGIYLLTLAKGTASPFAPKSDEVKIDEPAKDEKKKDAKEEKPAEKRVSVVVDEDGLQSRIAMVPVKPSSYRNLQSVGSKLYFLRRGGMDEKSLLLMYDLEKKKETELGNVNGYEISADGKKMLVGLEGQRYAIIDLPSAKIDVKEHLNLSDMKVRLDRQAEWKQIFHESWRHMKYFFFHENMHGVDWDAMRALYAELLPYVNHRADLTYVIGEMISELNIGHAYVGGGEMPRPERIQLGLLGAAVERDNASGYFRITRILRGQNWTINVRSPLTEIGVDAKVNDFIIAVDGKPANSVSDLFELLVGKAGKQVELTLNTKPSVDGARKTIVIPTGDEQPLYYHEWVQGNIKKVSDATGGRVGYIHVPDMGPEGLNEFVKHYFPQLRKEALIVDVRGNGGGNVSPMIIERLARTPVMLDLARNTAIGTDPSGLHVGPKVMLMDEFSASDGDIVTYRFRKMGLGPLIGKRSWGGVVGIRGTLPLLDGGFLNRPEFANYDLEGQEWIMEGHGVDPDIIVDNYPPDEFLGKDAQLQRGIDEIMEMLKKNPPRLAPPPPGPQKN